MRPSELKKAGMSYARIARRLQMMRSDGKPNGERFADFSSPEDSNRETQRTPG